MRHSILAGLVLIALVVTLPLPAEEPLNPEKVRAIRELMDITGAQASRKELASTFTQQLVSVLRANGVTVDRHTSDIIYSEVDSFIAEQLDDEVLQQKMYRIYARYFTLEELEGLIAFNRTPVGAKANRVMPILMRESMNAAQSWSEEIGPALSARVRQRLEEEGVSLSGAKQNNRRQ